MAVIYNMSCFGQQRDEFKLFNPYPMRDGGGRRGTNGDEGMHREKGKYRLWKEYLHADYA